MAEAEAEANVEAEAEAEAETTAEAVKSTPLTTENWLRKLCTYSMNNNMSNEDKHDTNYINNKYTNTYHAQVAQPVSTHLERAVSLHLLMSCHMHLMAQGVLESHPIRIVIHVRFSLSSSSPFTST